MRWSVSALGRPGVGCGVIGMPFAAGAGAGEKRRFRRPRWWGRAAPSRRRATQCPFQLLWGFSVPVRSALLAGLFSRFVRSQVSDRHA